MLGAYVLARELDRAGDDIARAFSVYEQRLRPYMLRQQHAAARFAGSFAPKTALGIRVRDAVVNLMNIPAVGTLLVRSMFGNSFRFPLE